MSVDARRRAAEKQIIELGYEFDGDRWRKPMKQRGPLEHLIVGSAALQHHVHAIPAGYDVASITISVLDRWEFLARMRSDPIALPMVGFNTDRTLRVNGIRIDTVISNETPARI